MTFCICCCQYADQFTRADSGTLGSAWIASAGTWAIVSNKLRVSTGTGLTYWNIANSRAGGAGGIQSASVKVNTTAAGRKIRLCVGYLDDDNYIALQVFTGTSSPNDGHISIIQRVAGVETETVGRYFNIDLTGARTLRVTYTPAPDLSYAEFAATLDNVTSIATLGASSKEVELSIYRVVAYTGGDKAALAVAGGTGNVDFDDFSFPDAVTGITTLVCADYTIGACGTPDVIASSPTTVSNLFSTGIAFSIGGTIGVLRWPHTRGISRGAIRGVFQTGSLSTRYIEAYVDWIDANNHHVARIDFAPPNITLTVKKVVAGVATTVYGPTTRAGGSTTSTLLYLYCDDAHFVRYNDGSVFNESFTSSLVGGTWWAYATNFSTTNQINIIFAKDPANAYDVPFVNYCYDCSTKDFTTP